MTSEAISYRSNNASKHVPGLGKSSFRAIIAAVLIVCLGGAISGRVSAQTFDDVPTDYWAFSFIESFAASGITSGCGDGNYCPEGPVTRAQMAVFLERGIRGSDFSPPAATGNLFLDLGASDFAAAFIEQLSLDGITGGCGGNNYCPDAQVTRAQMAVFLLRAKHGAGYSPPAASGVFTDAPQGSFAVDWIEQLAAEGITSGCGGGNYCPSSPVTRAQMAVFLVRTFNLPPAPVKVEYDNFHSNFEVPSGSQLIAQADFNGDGLTDLIAGGGTSSVDPLVLLLSNGDGTLRNGTSEIILGDPRVNNPRAATGDFNSDGKLDVAVFDLGFIPPGKDGFEGYPPILLLSNADGKLEVSTALADAAEDYNINETGKDPLCVGCPFSGRNIGARSVTTVDVNRDGNLDIFVESSGAENITSHFYINNGDGTFVIDHNNRLTENAHFNHQNFTSGEFWRHYSAIFVDVNNDDFLDLVMGQQHSDPGEVRSLVLVNDRNGFFPVENRFLLSRPDFNDGFSAVRSIVTYDLNDDGLTDLVFAHERRLNLSDQAAIEFTGRYIQILINNGGGQFSDETMARMGDQSATTPTTDPFHGSDLQNVPRQMFLIDIDQDGDVDLIAARNASLSPASPLIYLNDRSGRFAAQDTDVFTGGELFVGENSVPIDLNNDGLIDFASTDVTPGVDGVFGTPDDMFNFPSFLAVLVP